MICFEINSYKREIFDTLQKFKAAKNFFLVFFSTFFIFSFPALFCNATILLALALGGALIFQRRNLYRLSWQLPGPPALPLIGNGLFFFRCDFKDVLKEALKVIDAYPSPFRLWVGPSLVLFVKDPDQLQTIMQSSKYTKKSFVYNFLRPFIGKGLFTSNGSLHKNQRKTYQSLFGPKLLEGYSALFQKHAENLVLQMQVHLNKDPFDALLLIHQEAFNATMDIILEANDGRYEQYKQIPGHIRTAYKVFVKRIIMFWMYWTNIYKATELYQEQREAVKSINGLIRDLENNEIVEIRKRISTETVDDTNKRAAPSVMEMMLQIHKDNPTSHTYQDFVDNLRTFAATSQDTQSSAIAFTLMMLGMHKDIQSKVVSELKEVLEDRKELSLIHAEKLTFMEMCIKESMRLFPVGPFLPRDVIKGFKLDNWYVPEGCSLVLGIYNVQRDPKHWEKPDEFYPEHFTQEAMSKRHPYAFLPFSGGPRRCVAQQYSYVNMKIIIANVLMNYVIDCPFTLETLDLFTDISIRPREGYQIQISKRIWP